MPAGVFCLEVPLLLRQLKQGFDGILAQGFRRAQTLLAGIEWVQMIRKGQLQHPAGDRLSPAEQFYLLVA